MPSLRPRDVSPAEHVRIAEEARDFKAHQIEHLGPATSPSVRRRLVAQLHEREAALHEYRKRLGMSDMATYIDIARSLREFGYPGVSGKMIAEVHEAMRAGKPLPHGVIGMFAQGQLEELEASA